MEIRMSYDQLALLFGYLTMLAGAFGVVGLLLYGATQYLWRKVCDAHGMATVMLAIAAYKREDKP